MRKLVVIEMITLDGVMQAPGGPKEDPSGGFTYGGWMKPYIDDFGFTILREQLGHPYELLLGKTTYDIWAGYWPYHNESFIGEGFNKTTKYVASHEPFTPSWDKTIVLTGDVAKAIKKLKQEKGPEIQVHGSGNLDQTLLKHDLVDELWLKIVPITLGQGKRLFADGTMPAAFTLIDSKVSPKGVIFANYKRSGKVKTGTIG